jgi:hypothetical protein
MAKTKNVLMINSSGHIDKQIVFKRYGEKTVISKYPNMSKVKRSDKQKRMNDMMEAANEAAHQVIDDDQLKMEAQIRLDVSTNKLYTALVREFFQHHKDDKDPLGSVGLERDLDSRKWNKKRKYKRRQID